MILVQHVLHRDHPVKAPLLVASPRSVLSVFQQFACKNLITVSLSFISTMAAMLWIRSAFSCCSPYTLQISNRRASTDSFRLGRRIREFRAGFLNLQVGMLLTVWLWAGP